MILYSSNCPKCVVLKKKLEQKGVSFEISNDFDKLIENNIMSLPVLEVNGTLLKFDEAIEYINTLEMEN